MATINYLTLRPEQAIKIYDDYINEGKKQDALLILFRFLSSFGSRNRKTNYADQSDVSVASNIQHLYKLMTSYIQLRIQIGINLPEEQNQLKEVFKAFRQMTQHNHINSFFDIIILYRGLVEQIFADKVKEYPIEELQKLPFVGQLSYEEPAEELLYLSFDPEAKNNKDQQKACLRSLWETYRTLLENVKWNEKMEEVYFDTIKRVSNFCTKYKRKAEFQWFCEQINKFVLEQNQADLKKNPTQVDLSKPLTNDKHVAVRFEIVRTAMGLEMWAEAFRTLETILVLKNLRRGNFKTSFLLLYYDLLAQIFAKSGNSLYQAFAYYNHYCAFKKKPVTSQEEIQQKSLELSSKLDYLVLSVLVIPLEDNQQRERVALFEQGTKIPTREELMKILGEINAVQFVSPAVRQVYQLLQRKQDLLTVADFKFEQLPQQFVPALKENLIGLVLESISQMYRTIRIQELSKILKFAEQDKIFQVLVYSHKKLQCKVDFQNQIIHFQKQTLMNAQLLPTLLNSFQLNKEPTDPIELAKKQLLSSNLDMLTREQIIRKLLKQADPNQLNKEWKEARQQEKQQQEQLRKVEDEKKRFEQEKINEMELRKAKELSIRQKILQDIIKLKGGKYVTFEINQERKKIELLKDHHLLEIDTGVLQDIKKKFEEEAKKGADDKYIRGFKKNDYIERERQKLEAAVVATWVENDLDVLKEQHKQQHDQMIALKEQLGQTFKFADDQCLIVKQQKELEYEEVVSKWKAQLNEKYKGELQHKAQILKQESDIRKEEEQKRLQREEEERKRQPQQSQPLTTSAIPQRSNVARVNNDKQQVATTSFTIARNTESTSFTNTKAQQQQQQQPGQTAPPKTTVGLFRNTGTTANTNIPPEEDQKYNDPKNKFAIFANSNKTQQQTQQAQVPPPQTKPQVQLSRNNK